MIGRPLPHFIGVAVLAGWAPLGALGIDIQSVSAQPCPDVEVVFARGTTEPAGVGATGQALVDALGPRLGGRSLGEYGINYPATTDFATGVQGLYDAKAHIETTAATCPNTQMVLGGYSQGAAIAGFATSSEVPAGVSPNDVPAPLSPNVANHIAAVTLFGTPNTRFMDQIGQPPVVIGPLYTAKTIQLCVPDDPICSNGGDWAAHNQYAVDGTPAQAADFVVSHLGPAGNAPPSRATPAPPAAPPPAPGEVPAPGQLPDLPPPDQPDVPPAPA